MGFQMKVNTKKDLGPIRNQAKKKCPDCGRVVTWWEPSDTTRMQCICGKVVWVKNDYAEDDFFSL